MRPALSARNPFDRGVVLPPSQFEAWFVSLSHDETPIDRTVDRRRRGP